MIKRRDSTPLRLQLHAGSARCYWCRQKTLLPTTWANEVPGNQATIDHIVPRLDCVSSEEYHDRRNQVLACHDCNQRRNEEWLLVNRCFARAFARYESSVLQCDAVTADPEF